jgi:hypothetical protein
MKLYRFLLISIALFFFSIGYCQKNSIDNEIDKIKKEYAVPHLTNEQMKQDFDYLIKIIKNNNPQILVRKKITGIDIVGELDMLAKQIDTISNIKDFIVLVYRAIRLTQDPHATIASGVYYFNRSVYKRISKKLKLTNKEYAYNFNYLDIIRDNFEYVIDFIYKNQNYYLKYDLDLFIEGNKTVISKGSKIISINNLSVNSFINKYISYQEELRWDFRNNSFYVSGLEKPKTIEIYEVGFINRDGKIIDFECDSFNFNRKSFNPFLFGKPHIYYFSSDSLLYVRCPLMSLGRKNFYKEEILKYKDSVISNIIIDVRGNYGGSDELWMSILSYIIDKPIATKVTMAMCKDIDFNSLSKKQRKRLICKQIPYLDSTTFILLQDEMEYIKPNKKSIMYEDKIFILQDEDIYSSTGCLTATALKSDRLVSIGVPTGKLLGRGITPSVFLLPNSKFLFNLHTVIDISETTTVKDLYHDSVEVKLDLPVSYYLNNANDSNLYSKEYLLNQDIFFNKVLFYIRK